MVATELPAPPLAQTHQIWYLSLSLSLSQVSNKHKKKKSLKLFDTKDRERERERKFFLFLRDLNNDLKKIVELSSGGLISSHVMCSMSWILSSSFFFCLFVLIWMVNFLMVNSYVCLLVSFFFKIGSWDIIKLVNCSVVLCT